MLATESCRSLPPSEYYGSMAAGSIMGASCGNSVNTVINTARWTGLGHSDITGHGHMERRNNPRANVRIEHICRAMLISLFECYAVVPECCLRVLPALGSELAPALGLDALEQKHPHSPPTRTVWLVLTVNAITVYESASRRKRLATFDIRRMCAVLPAPPHTSVMNTMISPRFGVVCGFLRCLPTASRASPWPLSPTGEAGLAVASFYFLSVEKQLEWLKKLRQAAEPIPIDSTLGTSLIAMSVSAIPCPCTSPPLRATREAVAARGASNITSCVRGGTTMPAFSTDLSNSFGAVHVPPDSVTHDYATPHTVCVRPSKAKSLPTPDGLAVASLLVSASASIFPVRVAREFRCILIK